MTLPVRKNLNLLFKISNPSLHKTSIQNTPQSLNKLIYLKTSYKKTKN